MSIQLLNDYYTHAMGEDLTPSEAILFHLILFRANKEGICTHSLSALYRQVNISLKHGGLYLGGLEAKGYLKRYTQGLKVLRPIPQDEAPELGAKTPESGALIDKTIKTNKTDRDEAPTVAPVSVSYAGQQSPARNFVNRATRSPEMETFLKAYGKQPRDWEAFTVAFPNALEECQSLEVLCECAQRAYQKLVEVDETRFWPRPEKWLANCEYRAYLRLSQQNQRVVKPVNEQELYHLRSVLSFSGYSEAEREWILERTRHYLRRGLNIEDATDCAYRDFARIEQAQEE